MTLGWLSNIQLWEVVRIAEIRVGSTWHLARVPRTLLQASSKGLSLASLCHGVSPALHISSHPPLHLPLCRLLSLGLAAELLALSVVSSPSCARRLYLHLLDKPGIHQAYPARPGHTENFAGIGAPSCQAGRNSSPCPVFLHIET